MKAGGNCKMDVDSPNALKRCSSAPQINNLLPSTSVGVQPMEEGQSQPVPSTSGNIANSASISTTGRIQNSGGGLQQQHLQQVLLSDGHSEPLQTGNATMLNTNNFQQGSTATGSRESLPTSFSNIFTPRVRRFSASFSPLAVISNGSASPGRNGSGTPGPRLTPRISQLRQEECADVSNSREVNHEREIHTAMQMSQSCEDLTLVAENWSFSSGSAGKMVIDDLQNPLHVALPTIGSTCCSSPSPTSRGGIGLQYPTTSPSPTRKFVTRRSMSPCPLRPSPLSSSVKRKFDLEDNYGNCYSPPSKKIFSSERGTSPICQTPSSSPICPSPDSSTTSFENGSNNNNGLGGTVPLCGPFPLAAASSTSSGRITPKFFLTKLSGIPSPGAAATVCSSAPFGTMHFGGNSGSSSACSTPTGIANPIGSLGGGNAAIMMDCGVSSSTGGVAECRDSTMEVSHTLVGANMYEDRSTMVVVEDAVEGRSKDPTVSSGDSIKMACDEGEANISDNRRQRRLTSGQTAVAISASRELREQVLKSALDPDAAGSCNSNSSNSSSTSSSSSNSSSSSSSTTSDSNNSANTNSSRMSSGPGSSSNSSSTSNTSSSSSVDTGGSATAAGTAGGTICPPLTSFPMMAIPSNLAEIAES